MLEYRFVPDERGLGVFSPGDSVTPLKSLGAARWPELWVRRLTLQYSTGRSEVKTVYPDCRWEATARIWQRFDENSDRRKGNDRQMCETLETGCGD